MSVEMLLEACRIDEGDPGLTPEVLSDFTAASTIAERCPLLRRRDGFPLAATLLAAGMGAFRHFAPRQLPFGHSGPQVYSFGWVHEERIELIMKQLLGFAHPEWSLEEVTSEAEIAVSRAISLALVERTQYDAWEPGMKPGSGKRWAVAATAFGLARARKAAESIESEPKQPDYPWRTSAPATAPQGATAMAVDTPALSPKPAAATPVQTDSNIVVLTEMTPELAMAVNVATKIEAKCPPTPAPRAERTPDPTADDPYGWARQVDVITAVSQVLGGEDGERFDQGTLSRLCTEGEIKTNGKTRRALLINVDSFLAWLEKNRRITQAEIDQVRNAIIGEIRERKLREPKLRN